MNEQHDLYILRCKVYASDFLEPRFALQDLRRKHLWTGHPKSLRRSRQ